MRRRQYFAVSKKLRVYTCVYVCVRLSRLSTLRCWLLFLDVSPETGISSTFSWNSGEITSTLSVLSPRFDIWVPALGREVPSPRDRTHGVYMRFSCTPTLEWAHMFSVAILRMFSRSLLKVMHFCPLFRKRTCVHKREFAYPARRYRSSCLR